MSIDELAKSMLSSNRKKLFGRRPIFERYAGATPDELRNLERKIGLPIPASLRDWLLAVGYGDIDEDMSFRKEWFAAIETGQLKGGAIFSQDALGNFYAFDPSGRIFFLSRHEAAFAVMSEDFLGFIDELTRRDYKLTDWVDRLETQGYEW